MALNIVKYVRGKVHIPLKIRELKYIACIIPSLSFTQGDPGGPGPDGPPGDPGPPAYIPQQVSWPLIIEQN